MQVRRVLHHSQNRFFRKQALYLTIREIDFYASGPGTSPFAKSIFHTSGLCTSPFVKLIFSTSGPFTSVYFDHMNSIEAAQDCLSGPVFPKRQYSYYSPDYLCYETVHRIRHKIPSPYIVPTSQRRPQNLQPIFPSACPPGVS